MQKGGALVWYHCNQQCCISLCSPTMLSKESYLYENYFLVLCSCLNPANDACCESFCVGWRPLARSFLFKAKIQQEKTIFLCVACRQPLHKRLRKWPERPTNHQSAASRLKCCFLLNLLRLLYTVCKKVYYCVEAFLISIMTIVINLCHEIFYDTCTHINEFV